MVVATISGTEPFYPAIVVVGLRALTLQANFGQHPFKCNIEDVLRGLAAQRQPIQHNARVPTRWGYHDCPSLDVCEDQKVYCKAINVRPRLLANNARPGQESGTNL